MSAINLTMTVAMVTKMAAKNRLKIGELPFWDKFETLDRDINIEPTQIPKYILADNVNCHRKNILGDNNFSI